MKHVLLIGPPGAGKSTLIEVAQARGIRAEDLENYGHGSDGYEMRLEKARELSRETGEGFMLVGMADIDPVIFPKSSIQVMLLPSRFVYEQRLKHRDALHSRKQGQEGLERKYNVFVQWSKKFEHVIESDTTPEQDLDQILAFV
ncbi:hypothetical protein HZA87_02975 [Candidatus Uhrbacteria bacterium]|nr:hypothetical protein [Candidatus Uhrbacteria bacterium]